MNNNNNWLPLIIIIILLLGIGGWFVYDRGYLAQFFDQTFNSGQSSSSDSSSTNNYAYEDTALEYTVDTTYYNDYLGVSYTVPKNWWLYELDEYNFAEKQGETNNADLLNILTFDDDAYLELISVGNKQFSADSSHLGFSFNAEKLATASTLGEYMTTYEEYMLEPTETETVTLVDSSTIKIGNRDYAQRIFEIARSIEDDAYMVLTLTTKVKNDYYLNVDITYWPEMSNAGNIAINNLEKNLLFY